MKDVCQTTCVVKVTTPNVRRCLHSNYAYCVSANDIKFTIEYHANIERKYKSITLSSEFFLTTFGGRR